MTKDGVIYKKTASLNPLNNSVNILNEETLTPQQLQPYLQQYNAALNPTHTFTSEELANDDRINTIWQQAINNNIVGPNSQIVSANYRTVNGQIIYILVFRNAEGNPVTVNVQQGPDGNYQIVNSSPPPTTNNTTETTDTNTTNNTDNTEPVTPVAPPYVDASKTGNRLNSAEWN